MIDHIATKRRNAYAAIGAFAATACCAAIIITPQTARAADSITLAADGTVPSASVPADGTPAITKVRVLNEGAFLEVYWNEYVDENAAVDPANYVLRNGATTIALEAKNDSWSNTIYFDKTNKELAAEASNVMGEIDPGLHMASIGYQGTIDASQPITLEVKGSAIKDADGNAAADATYAGVPKTNYYTQYVTSKTGIVVKGDADVSQAALDAAAAQVDVELGKTDNGIAAQMAKAGASLAVFPPKENVYFLPEHRGGFDKTMYAVEGYGGNAYNGNVSSIAERNVLRIRNAADGRNTMYTNENILIHEFGHAVKSVGMEGLADQSLSREFQRLYRSRKALGMWPNTYAISNSDEFFATMAAIWFNVMDEAPDFTDGTRSPINTRAELKAYDPKTYAFFEKIFPDADLASPWAPADMPANRYTAATPEAPSGDMNVAPFADATASHSNQWSGGVDKVNDATASANAGMYDVWNNWSTDGDGGNYGDATGPWVQLAWDGQVKLTSVNLKLWSDGDGVPQLSGDGKWKLQYDASADGTGSGSSGSGAGADSSVSTGSWTDVPLAAGVTYGSSYGTDGNEVKFASPITASRLRVVFAAGTVAGVSEFETYGQEVTGSVDPDPEPEPEPDHDRTLPMISGASDVTIDLGAAFDAKAGVSAKDDRDGDLTASIEVSGKVDTSKAGAYTLIYKVSDKAGNTMTVTRVVTVRAKVNNGGSDKPSTDKPGTGNGGSDNGNKPAEPSEPSKPAECVASFKDVTAKTPHAADIAWLACQKIARGFDDGTFGGMRTVVRQDMAAFLYRLAGSPAFDADKALAKKPFTDVTKDTPHYKEILWLASTGIAKGYLDRDGKTYSFGGMRTVVRQDMAAFLHRYADWAKANPTLGAGVVFTDVTSKTPHADDIAWLARTGVTQGFTDKATGKVSFGGMRSVVRQDMAAFLHRMDANVLKK